jgi:hypothetical protein
MTSDGLIIQLLDEDCLVEIFSYLSIYDLIRTERVCRTFREVCQHIYPRFQKMRIELRYLDVDYFKAILNRISPYLKSFKFSGGYIMDDDIKKTLIAGVLKSPHLQRLVVNYTQFSKELMLSLATSFQLLTFLDLARCNLNEENMENIFDNSILLKNLKVRYNNIHI